MTETIENYDATIRFDGQWWIGWFDALPGANAQGATRKELLGNLRSVLCEALEPFK